MKGFSRNESWIRTGLTVMVVVLLFLQMNAMTIHEYNLREQGYRLVHVEPWNLGDLPGSMTFRVDGVKYYNTALCVIHHWIYTLARFASLGIVLLILGLSVSFLPCVRHFTPYVLKEFLRSSIHLRAPPLT